MFDFIKNFFTKQDINKDIKLALNTETKDYSNTKVYTGPSDNDHDDYMKSLKDYSRQYDPLNIKTIAKDDFLRLAASAGHRAKIAIKNKDYELAWDLYTEQQSNYFKSCEEMGQDPRPLDGSVSFSKANVLRLEGNHLQALTHLIYAISTHPNVAYMMKKLPAYYNRSKLNRDIEEITYFIYEQQKNADFKTIQNKVQEWSNS